MKLKTVEVDGVTYAEVKDGNPVFIDGDKEVAIDVPATAQKVSTLNYEAMERRKAMDELTSKLKAFEGIEDPEEARKALQTMQNLDDKKLIDAGEVERVKQSVVETYEKRLAEIQAKADEAAGMLHREKIGGAFARSEFIKEKLALPVDFIEAKFGSHFTIDGGEVIAKDAKGNQIFSPERPGEPASFNEAIEILVSQHPQRDSILKGRNQNGSGAPGGSGGAQAKVMSRAEYEALPVATQAARIADGYTLTE